MRHIIHHGGRHCGRVRHRVSALADLIVYQYNRRYRPNAHGASGDNRTT